MIFMTSTPISESGKPFNTVSERSAGRLLEKVAVVWGVIPKEPGNILGASEDPLAPNL